jgi:hypothetical protein
MLHTQSHHRRFGHRNITFANRSYKLPLPAQTLGSWVKIPLESFMFVCIYSEYIVRCVDSGLTAG